MKHKLYYWLQENNLTNKELSKILNCSIRTVQKYLAYDSVPSVERLIIIEILTDYAVTAQDFALKNKFSSSANTKYLKGTVDSHIIKEKDSASTLDVNNVTISETLKNSSFKNSQQSNIGIAKVKNIGFIVAMEEELEAIKNFCTVNNVLLTNKKNSFNLTLYNFTYNNFKFTVAVSKIGKVASAIATTLLITHYNCDLIINLGSCGGLNNTPVGSVILSNSSGYTDVDVTAFGYKLGQLPQQPHLFTSPNNYYSIDSILNKLSTNDNVVVGTVICNDSFIANKDLVEKIKNIYPQTKAVDMESTAIAQVCYLFNKDFLLVKKVSDSADAQAAQSFSAEIQKMNETLPHIIKIILDNIK